MDKEAINDRFVKAINTLISDKGIPSKGIIANTLGINPTKLSEILNKRMNVGTDLAADICDIFCISAQWLLTGKGKMFDESSNTEESLLKNDIENTQIISDKESTYYILYKEEKEENKALLKEIGRLEERLEKSESSVPTVKAASSAKSFSRKRSATSVSAQSKE